MVEEEEAGGRGGRGGGGVDNLQSKWAATEGDSVSGGNGTARIPPGN